MHLALKLMVNGARHQLGRFWEEVVQQAREDAGVISSQLAQVKIPQRPQKDLTSN